MDYKPRIYISAPGDANLAHQALEIKQGILDLLEEEDLEPQSFMESGLPANMPWNFASAHRILQRCQGAIIMGLTRSRFETTQGLLKLPTEYNQIEGSLALSLGLPALILCEDGIPNRGIFYRGSDLIITHIPENAGAAWLESKDFKQRFKGWLKAVRERYDVFFGYSSAARPTADALLNFLGNKLKVSVLEYGTGFFAGGTILEEIERSAGSCLCGIFLFAKDDPLAGGKDQAAPRDNVIFEAGFFMHAKGKERTLIIHEEGAKIPADVGGNIYLELKDRADISPIETRLRDFLEKNL